MNLTLTQSMERAKDLSGEIKAADEMERLTADTLAAKEHEVTLARQAHDKAVAAKQAKCDEREALATHIAGLVRAVGEPTPTYPNECQHTQWSAAGEGGRRTCLDCGETATTFNSVFAQDALTHAEERMNGAFDRATG